MMRARRPALGAMLALGLLLLVGCAGPKNDSTPVSIDAPSYASFRDAGVSDFLVARCGSLDCHGRPERPLRLQGQDGLRRLDAGTIPLKESATTEDEHRANWDAVVGLEPERMSMVQSARGLGDCPLPGDAPNERAALAGDACVRRLLLVSKPLGCSDRSRGCEDDRLGVEHKGGPVLAQGDDGYGCLVSWLRGAADAARCAAAATAFKQ